MKSIIQKGIIPSRTQSQDKKFQTSRPCEVRRSGQVTTFVVGAAGTFSNLGLSILLTFSASFVRHVNVKIKKG